MTAQTLSEKRARPSKLDASNLLEAAALFKVKKLPSASSRSPVVIILFA